MTAAHTQFGWKPLRWLVSGISLWVVSAMVVFAMHGAGIAALMTWGDSAPAGSPDAAIMLDKVKVAITVPTPKPILYPVAPLPAGPNAVQGEKFVDFLFTAPAQAILGKYGFGKP